MRRWFELAAVVGCGWAATVVFAVRVYGTLVCCLVHWRFLLRFTQVGGVYYSEECGVRNEEFLCCTANVLDCVTGWFSPISQSRSLQLAEKTTPHSALLTPN